MDWIYWDMVSPNAYPLANEVGENGGKLSQKN